LETCRRSSGAWSSRCRPDPLLAQLLLALGRQTRKGAVDVQEPGDVGQGVRGESFDWRCGKCFDQAQVCKEELFPSCRNPVVLSSPNGLFPEFVEWSTRVTDYRIRMFWKPHSSIRGGLGISWRNGRRRAGTRPPRLDRQQLQAGARHRLTSVGEEDGGAVDFPIPFGEGHGETGNVGAACCCGVQRWACGSTSGSTRRCETA